MASVSKSTDWVTELVAGLPPLLTLKEVMSTLRVGDRTARRMIADVRLRALREVESGSSRIRVPRAEIERHLRGLL